MSKELRMYKDGLKTPPFYHFGSENGKWQRNVASFIEKHSGLSMSFLEFMPRGDVFKYRKS